ncbi:MAG: DUF2029 domain-containing protein [Chloroflexi bacterium]|nr:MAG: DUF2029 domain-containing protein [Chloroflexota bacterium]MBL1195559.1 DUF2029 domain-containing protein [Chloroflexota bacterium]NOH12842.1 DUF2029 domain-containing protein [Chloroflexota bacterium]
MRVQRPDLAYLALIVGSIIVLLGLSFINYRYAVTNTSFRDQFTPRWLGTRLFLTAQIDPYSVEATRTIQQQMLGRFAVQGEDQQLFLYPFYSLALYTPFSLIGDNLIARAAWMTLLEVGLLGLAIISMNVARWRPPWPVALGFIAFAFTWYHGARPLLTSNIAILAAFAIGVCLWGIRHRHDGLAGVALGLASVKPQMVVLLLPLIFIWALSRRRWSIPISATIVLLVLLLGSLYFSPDWYILNLQQIGSYQVYAPPGSLPAIISAQMNLFGNVFAWIISIVFALILLREWLLVLGKDEDWFLWVAALTLVITNMIGIRTATENYVALLPVIALVYANWEQRLQGTGRILIVFVTLLLLVGLWALFFFSNSPGEPVSERLLMYFPVPILLFFSLYWVRWWVTQSRNLPTGSLQAIRRL